MPLSPSFVAYELEMSTSEAEECLDELVRDSVLVFDFDQDGEIYYRPGSAYTFEDHEPPTSSPSPGDEPAHQPTGAVTPGATDGHAGSASHPKSHFTPERGRGARRNQTRAEQFDGATRTTATSRNHRTGSTRQRHGVRSSSARAGAREYVPPRRHTRKRRPSARGASTQPRANKRANQQWAEIGPDGCDGSIGTPGDVAPGRRPPQHAPTSRPTTPSNSPSNSPWSEHRRQAGLLKSRQNTDMVATSSDSKLPARKQSRADPLLASFLSLVFVGSGQLYNGEFAKGVAFFVSFIVLWAFALGWMVHIWAAVDAYQIASHQRELK